MKQNEIVFYEENRPINNAELERFVELWNEAFWSADEVLNSLNHKGAVLAVLENSGRWQGLVLGRVVAGECEIFFVFVDPKNRGQGLGKMLVSSYLRHIGQVACEVFLEVRHTNLPALGLYESLGFQKILRRAGYYSDGEDALVLKKDLSFTHDDSAR